MSSEGGKNVPARATSWSLRFRWRALTLCGALAACQASPVVSTKPTPHTLVYSYMMAHGMARGAVMSGGITPRRLTEIIVLDHEALLAVAREESLPSDSNMRAANKAIEQLIATTTPVDGAPTSPSPDTKSASGGP
ncbi:hypothetical protein [Acetobacter aceti]|uniref:hypothetical protein n=1 Tax=Acetobacter aceti TaxID=435 RepID=UPI0002260298|nr:hypothetical protein [Acetobacter aceti]